MEMKMGKSNKRSWVANRAFFLFVGSLDSPPLPTDTLDQIFVQRHAFEMGHLGQTASPRSQQVSHRSCGFLAALYIAVLRQYDRGPFFSK